MSFYTVETGLHNLFARVENSYGMFIKLLVIPVSVYSNPIAYTPPTVYGCIDQNTGFGIFNLTLTENTMAGGQPGLSFTYYTSYNLAYQGNPADAINDPYAYPSESGTVFARIQNNKGCFIIQEIILEILETPQIVSPLLIGNCDSDGDGLLFFDLPSYIPDLGIENPQPFVIHYYESFNYANYGQTSYAIQNPEAYQINAGQTVFIYVRINYADCYLIGTMILYTLDNLVITAEPSETICSGASATLTATTNGNILNWYDSETSQEPIYTGLLFDTPILTETTTYWVEAVTDICYSEKILIEVPVISLPDLILVNELPIETCAGEPLILNVETNGATVRWYDSSDAEAPVFIGLTFTPTLNETTTFWVEAVNISDSGMECPSEREPFEVVVLAIPALTFEAPIEICENTLTELYIEVDEGVIVNWYDGEDATEPVFTGNTYIVNLTETTIFWVEAVNTGDSGLECPSERIPFEVIVLSIPSLTFEAPIEICENTQTELSVTVDAGVTVNWYDDEDATEPVFTGNPYPVNLTETDTFWVEVVNISENGLECLSERMPFEVIVLSIPSLTFEASIEICENTVTELSVTVNAGVTVNWYDDEEATEPVFVGNPYPVSLTESTTFWLKAVNISESGMECPSEKVPFEVLVVPAPVLSFDSSTQVCEGSSATLTVATNDNATVKWYLNQVDEIPRFTGNPFTTDVLSETMTYWVEAVDVIESGSECVSERLPVTVEVILIPVINVTEPETICEGSFITLEADGNGDQVYWYANQFDTESIGTGNAFETPVLFETITYWLESVNYLEDGGSCDSERIPVTVTVIPIPELQMIQPNEICAGETVTLSVITNGETINWYATDTSETTLYSGNDYETDELFITTTFWVEAVTGDCATSREPVTVTVNPMPNVHLEDIIYWCDSLNDGREHVDLTQNNIIISNDPEVALTYYASSDDLANDSPIGNPENFPINSSSGVVYVSAAAGHCIVVVPLTIILTEAPVVSDTSLEICSTNGIGTYELTEANENIISGSTNYTITYHLSHEEAEEGINPLPQIYENTTASQVVYARIENINNPDCFSIALITLTFNDRFETITPLETCDEDRDGFAVFDLTEKQQEIEEEFGGSGYTIIYYETEADAYNNTNEIPNPESFTNQANPDTVYARVLDNDVCLGITAFDLILVQSPEVEVPDFITLCPSAEETVIVQSGFASYAWTNPYGTVISTTISAILDVEGIYILEITFADNICIFRGEIEVVFDQAPVVTGVEVTGNTVIVTASGTAPLEYSIDGGRTWQSSNVFYDLEYGEYEIKVRSANGCESGIYHVIVFELTNIITPNNDGYNDTWIIPKLVNYPGATLKIFDRNGKLLVGTNLENGYVWDGKYNGNPLPSTSYWYVLDLNNGQKMTGQITVKNY